MKYAGLNQAGIKKEKESNLPIINLILSGEIGTARNAEGVCSRTFQCSSWQHSLQIASACKLPTPSTSFFFFLVGRKLIFGSSCKILNLNIGFEQCFQRKIRQILNGQSLCLINCQPTSLTNIRNKNLHYARIFLEEELFECSKFLSDNLLDSSLREISSQREENYRTKQNCNFRERNQTQSFDSTSTTSGKRNRLPANFKLRNSHNNAAKLSNSRSAFSNKQSHKLQCISYLDSRFESELRAPIFLV